MTELKGNFKQLDDHIFLLKYENDYALDEILERGTDSVGDLLKWAVGHFKADKDDLKMNKGGYACTTFNATKENGDPIFARNFDYLDAPCLVVWTAPENGYKSIGITSTTVMLYGKKLGEKEKKARLLLAPYVCMDGINEKGLSIAVVEIKTKATNQNTGRKGIVTTLMIRAILDKCATIEEALEYFNKYDMHDSLFCNYHYQITDASGKSVVVEYINNKMVVLYPDDKYQYLVNKYASDVHVEKAFGFTREKWLKEEFEETNHIMDEERAMKILEKVRLEYRHKRGYMITSLWSAVYNNREKNVLLCAGMDYSKQYKFGVDCDVEF